MSSGSGAILIVAVVTINSHNYKITVSHHFPVNQQVKPYGGGFSKNPNNDDLLGFLGV